MKKFACMTIEHLAKELEEMILNSKKHRLEQDCDFAIINPEDYLGTGDTLEDIHYNASGWHGFKVVDLGFDSPDVHFCCDYYGGGCLSFKSFDICDNGLAKEIENCILFSFECEGEEVTKYNFLIVEFDDKK